MQKRNFIIVGIIFVLYFAIYGVCVWLQPTNLPNITNLRASVVNYPNCDSEETALTITSNKKSICLGTKGISIKDTHRSLFLLTSTDMQKISSLFVKREWFATCRENKVQLQYLADPETASLKEIGTFDLEKNEKIVDFFLSEDDTSAILLFSTELTAQATSDNKSRIRVFEVEKTNSQKIAKKRFDITSKSMEKVRFANMTATAKTKFIITEETYPFLESFSQIYLVNQNTATRATSCSILAVKKSIPFPIWQEQCKTDKPQSYTQDAATKILSAETTFADNIFSFDNSLLYVTESGKIVWENQHILQTLVENTHLLHNVETIQVIQSTRIGKTVYNCIDLGESSQITLSICIPIYD